MNHDLIGARLLGLSVSALLASGAAHAQQKIFITNGTQANKEIPLAAGSTVAFDTNGNLSAECALTDGVCTPLAGTAGGGAGAPTVTSFVRNDGDSDVRAGEFVRFTWASSQALACAAITQSAPEGANVTWSGVRALSNANGETVTLSVQGDYVFALQCFNGAGASVVSTIEVSVGESQVITNCDLPAHPLIQPAGWVRQDVDWDTFWSSPDGDPSAVFPNSVSFPTPINARRGGYTVVPFTVPANTDVTMFWDHSQGRPQDGFVGRPAKSVAISFSPCAGDVRAVSSTGPDRFVKAACRRQSASGSLTWSSNPAYLNSPAVCYLEAGVVHYMNVIVADVSDGLTAGEHTCEEVAASATECGAQGRHSKVN